MKQYTFRIDNKDPLYKKLIKLPTAYYRLKHDGNKHNIHSNNNVILEIGNNTNGVKLRWENDKIVLHKGSSALY
ncbi:hypothetical protein EJB10_02380 [Wolbachia endosymbiont of Brugia malayi]|uniref:hypothetical protein n=1 Tax=Wolbachia endosymbiont of Brugia malayi TaxID=80849 RepID=UPI00004C9254|nr:hypothetical protein [Wolbachia endosymbiont of Brugia malayi]AAW70659.1 Predicted protein [Wolbachia endosymbiont strain TRS of Brugia malayi]QCB61645.1 hypothetical protein EJB10_02380 [Wolbachia endosymbiont of Brugia malayi]